MVKKIFILIIFIAVVFNPAAISAQTATSSPQTIRDRLKNLREDRQSTIQETREQMKARMDTFKAQIRTIRDTRKQLLTEKISDKVASANARLTNKMDKALDHSTDILNRVKEKAAAFKVQEKDTTSLDQAISTAESAIATAQAAVDAQKSKEYTANITNEVTLRSTIGQMVSQFRQDISSVHKLIIDAKQAVQKAISELAKLRGENTATGSANI